MRQLSQHEICPHLVSNPTTKQAQGAIDNKTLCAKCVAQFMEMAARAPSALSAELRFDRCSHNRGLPCSWCRLSVSNMLASAYAHARLNGDNRVAHKLARLLKRMKATHGHLFYAGQHPHERSNTTEANDGLLSDSL